VSSEPSWIDFLPLAVIVIAAILVVFGGTKRLKCPHCGTVFDSPFLDTNKAGTGWTLPRLGTIKCPKCGESRARRGYPKAPADAPPST